MPRVPRPLPGCDLKSLPLSPTEAFLLSRIDAVVSERELSLITGLSPADLATALDRLHTFRAIDFVEDQRPSSARPPPPISVRLVAAPKSIDDGGFAPKPPAGAPSSATPPLYDPGELDEDVEIEPERRRRVLDLFHRLEDLSHYELLGVEEHAEKKQIKAAYYGLAPEFHPDKYFRKRLGSYKVKIETIFTRITLAHDVLTSKQRRAEYDEYLDQTHRNRAMAALLDQAPRDVALVSAALDESAAAAVGARPPVVDGAPLGVAGPAHIFPSPGRYSIEPSGPPSNPPASGSRGSELPKETQSSRRETLARKLGGGILRRSAPPSQSPAPDPLAAQRAVQELRHRYEAALTEARRVQLHRYLDLGRSALDRKDHAGAANAYRIAASLAPDDREVQATCEEAMRLAAAALAEGYWKQARYEEHQGRWAEAALSYAKACSGRPADARAHERVAFATLKSSANTRRAIEFARRAVELDPRAADLRLTLARAYAAAGFEKSAQAEIERARELAPNDAKIRELSVELREQTQKNGKSG